MPLQLGVRLGHYEIVSALGVGGMGEVYRARDSKLHREVAIKVLLEAIAQNPDRLARFQREAQLLASVNHPNIAHIYGLEDVGTVKALVMELVEGPTLADRIAQGQMPLDEVVPVARQIADALEAAHDRGIVHRDLKPANIKIRPDGTVKVLDFGLAKATEQSAASPNVSMSPTLTTPAMTQAGMILGTAAYMSPEQARGRSVDQRTDIWAFGCVLYEMLTGRRAFGDEDVTSTLAAIVLKDADLKSLPSETPTAIRRLLTRCLQKDPKTRLHHIADARLELSELSNEVVPQAIALPNRGRTRIWLATGTVVMFGLATVAVLQTLRLARATSQTTDAVRFSIPTPPGLIFGENDDDPSNPVVSPDGSRVVLVYRRGPQSQLYMRRIDEDEAKPIAGTEGGTSPFFSPDSKWIAFNQRAKIRKIAVDGGATVDIVASDFGTGALAPDDTIVFTPNYTSGLWRVSAGGGAPQKLTTPNAADGELGHFWPQLLPDGRTVLFTSYRAPVDTSRIETYSLDTGVRKVVVDGGFHGLSTSGGQLVFARTTTLFAVPFDTEKQNTRGQPVPVVAGVSANMPDGLSRFSISETGTLTYVPQAALNAPRQLGWVDRSGRVTPIGAAHQRFETPRLSPDGRRLAAAIPNEQDADVWIYDVALGTLSRVTASPGAQSNPVWSSDGRRLYFLFEEPIFHLYTKAVDTQSAPERLLDGPFDSIPMAATDHFLVYRRSDPATRGGIWLLPLDGDRKPRAFIDTPAQEGLGRLSPDGKWLAFESDETGRNEIFLQSFPDGAAHVSVSSNGGIDAKWSHDGTEIFFREGDKVMSASVRNGVAGRPIALFEKRWFGYDVAPDGRFIAILPDEAAPAPTVNVVLNWFSELERLVPTGR